MYVMIVHTVLYSYYMLFHDFKTLTDVLTHPLHEQDERFTSSVSVFQYAVVVVVTQTIKMIVIGYVIRSHTTHVTCIPMNGTRLKSLNSHQPLHRPCEISLSPIINSVQSRFD